MDCTVSGPSSVRSVGLVSPGWPVSALANGIVSYVATMVHGLDALGVHSHVLTPLPMSDSLEPFVHTVTPRPNKLLSKFMWKLSPQGWPNRMFCDALAREVQRLHREDGLQLLEMEESYGWARLLAGRSPVPLVVRLHGPWFLNGIANGAAQDRAFHERDSWERQGIAAAAGITAPSQHVLNETRSHFGLPLEDAQVIPNPVEPVGPADRWNLEGCDLNRIVFVGRFDRHKGGDTMLDAFAAVVARHPEARLDFIGPDRGCRDETGREWRFEQYLRQKLPPAAREKVTYHGFQPGSTAAELRKRALVTVAPSRYETFGIATAEAMMAGCPLVVCGAGALNELVQNDQNGLVARTGDATDVSEKVLSLLRNPQRAAELGRRAALDAATRYAPQVVARQTVEFYGRMLDRASRATGARASKPGLRKTVSVSP